LTTGDWVVSWDEETGEVIERPVTEWFRREAPAIIDIFIGVEKISCTIDHPFWVEDKGWVEASQIKPGTVLLDREGNALVVDVVRRRDEVTYVYNVEIEGLHTYFVSNLEILSHNACGDLIDNLDDLSPALQKHPNLSHQISPKYLDKHLPNTATSNNVLRKEGSNHVFNNRETLSKVESEILKRGEYTGNIRGTDRYGLRFDEPIGYRISADGKTVPLDYAEMKVYSDGRYHIIPRTGAAK
jgi:hypothetical protein